MGRAWPRFLPEPQPEAIAHAVIIEAWAIVIEQLAEGHAELIRAHEQAESYARTRYSSDDLRVAWNACAAAQENSNILLHHLVSFWPSQAENPREGDLKQLDRRSAVPANRLFTGPRASRRVAGQLAMRGVRQPAAAMSS